MDCGVHNPAKGGSNACENDDDFVYSFWNADGLPQDTADPTVNGGQFFFIDVPGHHPIEWGLSNRTWLKTHSPEGW